MTPAEQKGYKLGQAFWYIGDSEALEDGFDCDSPVYLHEDDDSNSPLFRSMQDEEELPKDDEGDIDGDYLSYIELSDVIPCQAGKTPCEIMGYKIGEAFEMNDTVSSFEAGIIVYLEKDDGTPRPKFISKDSDGDEDDYNYIELSYVTKVGSEPVEIKGQKDVLEGDYEVGERFIITGKEPSGKDPHHWPMGTIVRLNNKAARGRSRFSYHPEDNNGKPNGHIQQSVSADCLEPLRQPGDYSVHLDAVGDDKVAAIKAVRTITRLGLKESKDLVESSLPTLVIGGISEHYAYYSVNLIAQAGGKATMGLAKLSGTSARVVLTDDGDLSMVREQSDVGSKMIYFINGESQEVTLVGYFAGSPVVVLVDQWGDPKPIIAKASLLTPKE